MSGTKYKRELFIFMLVWACKCVPSWWLFVSVNELVKGIVRKVVPLSHEEAQKAGQLHSSRLHRELVLPLSPTQSQHDRKSMSVCVFVGGILTVFS